jgi:hypothetical protein
MADLRRISAFWLAGLLVLPLGACSGSLAEKLGMDKRAPDEFAVVARQPLIVPPNFDLRPPQPGAERPVGVRPSDRAYSSLTGQPPEGVTEPPAPAATGAAVAGAGAAAAGTGEVGAAAPMRRDPAPASSPGQSALLAQVDAVPTDPAIRERLAAESGTAEVDRAMLVRLMQEEPAGASGGRAPTVVRHEQRPLADLVEESL